MTKLDWDTLVEERNEWIAHNFPDQKSEPGFETTMGVVEEVGELAHCHLKELQGIRGTAEEHQANARDAIGDITVYLFGVMHHFDLRPGNHFPSAQAIPQTADQALLLAAWRAGGVAQGVHSGGERSIDYVMLKSNVSGLVFYLRHYCEARGWDYDAIVTETWNRVKQRDWQKNKETGGEVPVSDLTEGEDQ